MNISKIRSILYKTAKYLGDFDSIGKKRVGKRVKVIKNEVIKPNVIIHPKSIIGLISLNIKERKAHTVVKTVYSIGQNILPVVKDKIS